METTDEGGWVHLWLVLMKTFHALDAHAEASLEGCGLGQSDFRVLEVLLHKGALPVNTLGPKVHLTSGSISIAVDRLHAKQYVSRIERTEDRRVRVVDLTPLGRRFITDVFKHHASIMEAVMSGVSASERDELLRLLKKLGKYAEAFPKALPAKPFDG
jgi:MarR family transcriptional regulator, 2-MHQ and catechol-resistance regulon repressor